MIDVIDHLPPQNPEAEESVLGSILMHPPALDEIKDKLAPWHFYREKNGTIYETMIGLATDRRPVDFVTLTDALTQSGRYEEVGGLAYLSRLVDVVPTAVHIEAYADIVLRCAFGRNLISAAGKLAALGWDDSLSVDDKATRAQQLLNAVLSQGEQPDVFTPEQVSGMVVAHLESIMAGKPMGIPSSFPSLNQLMGGYQPGGLYVVGAPTGVGKTSWMLSEMRFQRFKKAKVFLASSEMTPLEIGNRVAAAELGRSWRDVEREVRPSAPEKDFVSRQALDAAKRAMGKLGDIYHGANMTTDKIRRRAARLQGRTGVDIVYVDYLQRLADAKGHGESREQQVTKMARALKEMALELRVPVVVAAQFSRAAAFRDSKEPTLSDFRESGGIEQEADVALGIFRESFFYRGTRPDADGHQVSVDPVKAELHVLKNRHGPADLVVNMNWRGEVCEYQETTSEREG